MRAHRTRARLCYVSIMGDMVSEERSLRQKAEREMRITNATTRLRLRPFAHSRRATTPSLGPVSKTSFSNAENLQKAA